MNEEPPAQHAAANRMLGRTPAASATSSAAPSCGAATQLPVYEHGLRQPEQHPAAPQGSAADLLVVPTVGADAAQPDGAGGEWWEARMGGVGGRQSCISLRGLPRKLQR
jgi:hypothetical protein